MKWYKITLTKDQISNNQGNKLIDELHEIYREEDEPEDMALFLGKHETEHRTYYFPPSSVKYVLIILSFYSGSKCDAPRFDEVEVALGASDAKDHFF